MRHFLNLIQLQSEVSWLLPRRHSGPGMTTTAIFVCVFLPTSFRMEFVVVEPKETHCPFGFDCPVWSSLGSIAMDVCTLQTKSLNIKGTEEYLLGVHTSLLVCSS